MSKLLEEAIVDAKKMKEVAIANAKATLEEAWEPSLKKILAAETDSEDEDEFEKPSDEEVTEAEETEEEEEVEEESISEEDDVPDEEEFEIEEDEEVDFEGEEDEYSYENIVKELEAEEEPEEEEVNLEAEEEEEEEEIDLESLLHELEETEEKDEEEEEVEENKRHTESRSIKHDLAKAKTKLMEYERVVKYLRKQLNEVNLLNSKLLFTNKLFQKKNLDESQKMKILDALDRAKNVREAKLIYATLEESFRKAVRKSDNSLLFEGRSSRSIKSTDSPKRKIIANGDSQVARMKQLAGIKDRK